jgi:hypothetical protein
MFEVGSAVCGAAQTMNAMIVGRAVAGLGVCANQYPTFVMSLLILICPSIGRWDVFGLLDIALDHFISSPKTAVYGSHGN